MVSDLTKPQYQSQRPVLDLHGRGCDYEGQHIESGRGRVIE